MIKSKKNILITGSHRSGTTWVGRTIAIHDNVRYIQEPFNVNTSNTYMELKLSTWFTHYPSSIQKEELKISFDRLFRLTPLEHAIKSAKVSDKNIKKPLSFCKHLLLESIFKPQILIKDPIALFSAEWLYQQYDLKVICMIRGPLAFVGSLKKANWDFDFNNLLKQDRLMEDLLTPYFNDIKGLSCKKEGNFIDRACLLWNVLHYVILKYQEKYSSWLFIKYEKIADNPKEGFEEIFRYLDLPINDKVYSYIEKFTSDFNLKEVKSISYQPRDSKRSLESWKERLTLEDKERILIATENISQQLGYQQGVL